MRRNHIWKKTAACIMAAIIAIAACGCGKEGSNESSGNSGSAENSVQDSSKAEEQQESEETESGEKVHLVMAMIDEQAVTANAKNLAETPFGKAWQEATGVELEIMQMADTDALSLLYAGGELPDLIYYPNNYPGGPVKAIKDKIILPLNDYMELAPDLQAVMDSNDAYAKSITTENGDIYCFPFIRGDDYLLSSAGLTIRKDWLDDLELAIPQTADDFYQVLKAFKEEKGASVPFSTGGWWLRAIAVEHGIITSPFGLVKGGFYQVDGKVHYGYAEQEYKDVLEYLHMLFEEGLLDPNFQSIDDNTVRANIMNGESGALVGAVGGFMGNILQTMEESDPDFDLAGFGPLVKEAGDMPMSTHYDWPVTGYSVVITPQCSNIEAAVKFLNYGYTEEGSLLFNYGIEGESYTMENGVPTYTDLIMNNPDGLTVQLAMAQYCRAWQNGPFVQQKRYQEQYSGRPQQVAALTAWTTSDASEYMMPALTIAEEDISEYSKLEGDINTYVEEMFIQYVTGLKSLDTFESEYLTTLESMKVDRVIELKQQALDAFNAR